MGETRRKDSVMRLAVDFPIIVLCICVHYLGSLVYGFSLHLTTVIENMGECPGVLIYKSGTPLYFSCIWQLGLENGVGLWT